MALQTPVALILFNRPDHAQRMLAEVAKVRPAKVLVIADGARENRPGEAEACEQTRRLVDQIDWPCEVLRNYSDRNLGCRRRISSGIDWVFSLFERAIFMEDDCLPHPTFFPFVEQMLERYCDDDRVMAVSGDNFQFGKRYSPYSYYFSAIPHCWGWATWRRAWKHFDVTMKNWPAAEASDFPGDFIPSPKAQKYNRWAMGEVFAGRIDSWAIPWEFACWQRRGLTVLPAVNLVSNVGFGVGATNCKKVDPFAASRRSRWDSHCGIHHRSPIRLRRIWRFMIG